MNRFVSGLARPAAAAGFGALAAAAMAPYRLVPLLLVAYGGLIWLLDRSQRTRRPHWSAFAMGWAFGFGFFALGIYWLGYAFLVQADAFGWMIPIALPAVMLFLALFFAGPAWITSFLWRPGLSRILLLSGTLAVAEYLRSTILTGFPWNLPVQALAGWAWLAQPAAWFGPYGLSFLVLLLAMLPMAGWQPSGRSLRPALAAGAGALVLFGAGAVRMTILEIPAPRQDVDLLLVQPNVPQQEKSIPELRDAHFRRTIEMSRIASVDDRQTIMIWPENVYPLLDTTPVFPSYLAGNFPDTASLVTGTVRRFEHEDRLRYANALAVFGTSVRGEKPLTAVYDKHHLVPFGEYLPLKDVFSTVGLTQLAPFADGFVPGPGPRLLSVAGVSLSPLICYEDVFPGALYPAGERPELLLVVTNDAWFGDGAGPRQHLDISRLRSIETGVPMARAANTGISAVIDAKGRSIAETALYTAETIRVPLPGALAPTLFSRLGNWLFALMVLVSIGIGVVLALQLRVDQS